MSLKSISWTFIAKAICLISWPPGLGLNGHLELTDTCEHFLESPLETCKSVLNGIQEAHAISKTRHEEDRHEDTEEHGQHGEQITSVDVTVALMLLGGVTFVMSLFTLVNYPDKDMRYYAWSVISTTISIFAAVLLYHSGHRLIHAYVLEKSTITVKLCVDLAVMIICFGLLQVSMAYTSGALEQNPCSRHRRLVLGEREEEFPLEDQRFRHTEERLQRARQTKCVATLLSHIAAFTAIKLGGRLQHAEFLQKKPLLTFTVAPAMYMGIAGLSRLCSRLRLSCLRPGGDTSAAPRTEETETFDASRLPEVLETQGEKDWEYVIHNWEDVVVESENDIASLCVSFLIVQACRYNVSGVMPDSLGEEEMHWRHSFACSGTLFGLAVFFALSMFAMVISQAGLTRGTSRRESSFGLRARVTIQGVLAMSFAWSLLYTVQWATTTALPDVVHPNAIATKVILALLNSTMAFLMIRCLDLLADSDKTDEHVDKAIDNIIDSIGILVGFSWEQSFDSGVGVISKLSAYPVLTDVGLAIFVVILVVEPWRHHVLEKVLRLQEERTVTPSHDSGKTETQVHGKLMLTIPRGRTAEVSLEEGERFLAHE